MLSDFPYPLLNNAQLIEQMNRFSATGKPFVFIISYDKKHGYVISESELDAHFIQFEINQHTSQVHSKSDLNIDWEPIPVDYKTYKQKFEAVMTEINQGNTFLLNLTQPTPLTTNLTLDTIYKYSKAKYKLWLRNQFVVLSPETFVQIDGDRLASFPMKGTIDASIPNAEKLILSDKKEKAEHATIVDLIRNDLSMVATDVHVKRFRYTDCLETNLGSLLQISSEITAVLKPEYMQQMGTLFMRLLPAGSISGAPKTKTRSIIQQVEGYERGFYTGVFGHFDGKRLNSAVMIRFIEQHEKGLLFKSGGGITSQSTCEIEYRELIQKVYVPIY